MHEDWGCTLYREGNYVGVLAHCREKVRYIVYRESNSVDVSAHYREKIRYTVYREGNSLTVILYLEKVILLVLHCI